MIIFGADQGAKTCVSALAALPLREGDRQCAAPGGGPATRIRLQPHCSERETSRVAQGEWDHNTKQFQPGLLEEGDGQRLVEEERDLAAEQKEVQPCRVQEAFT